MPDPIALSPARLDRLEAAIRSGRGKTRRSDALWSAFAEAFPDEVNRPGRRRTFLAALRGLEGRGVLSLPAASGRLWDRTLQPAVPTRVTLVVPDDEVVSDEGWKRRLWHPDLAWVPTVARLTRDQLAFLQRVEAGLVAGEFDRPVPVRTRSHQLTGDEKRLGALVRSDVLFGSGRLTLELIGCRDEPVPMAWERVGDGAGALILENDNPFTLARRVLSDVPQGRYGIVGWGSGRQAVQSIRHLATIPFAVREIHYLGDLDHWGIEIALGVRSAAVEAGLPTPTAVPLLHRRMLERSAEYGHPGGLPVEEGKGRPLTRSEEAWLRTDVRTPVVEMIRAGRRVPEEVLLAEDFEQLVQWA